MCRNVEICILRVDILEIGRYSEQPLKNKPVYVGKKSEAKFYMTSCIEWHQPVQEEADWLRPA